MRTFGWFGLASTVGAAAAAMLVSAAQAAVVTPGPAPSLNVASVPPPGSLGYDFVAVYGADTTAPNNQYYSAPGGAPFQVHSQSVSDSNPASSNYPGSMAIISFNPALNYYDTSGYAALTINGSADYPGFGFVGPETTPYLLATVTVGAGAPSSFIMGVEENNTGQTSDETSITVSGAVGTALLNAPVPGTLRANDFYYVTVTNASPGDQLTISGTNPAGSTGFSGITFDSVPEPATLGLIAMGAPLLLRRRRA